MSNSLDGHTMVRRWGLQEKGKRKEEEALAMEEEQ
jgi:hypothetical protein